MPARCSSSANSLRRPIPPQCELWLATRNAQRVTPDDDCEGHAQAVVWGLARTAALEYPDLRCVRVDLDDSADADRALVEEMLRRGRRIELAFRGSRRYVASVARVRHARAPPGRDWSSGHAARSMRWL